MAVEAPQAEAAFFLFLVLRFIGRRAVFTKTSDRVTTLRHTSRRAPSLSLAVTEGRLSFAYPRGTIGFGRTVVRAVMYYYNALEGEEELHDEDYLTRLKKGNVIERRGENWRIIDVVTTTGIGTPKPVDSIRIFLAGPVSVQ